MRPEIPSQVGACACLFDSTSWRRGRCHSLSTVKARVCCLWNNRLEDETGIEVCPRPHPAFQKSSPFQPRIVVFLPIPTPFPWHSLPSIPYIRKLELYPRKFLIKIVWKQFPNRVARTKILITNNIQIRLKSTTSFKYKKCISENFIFSKKNISVSYLNGSRLPR